MTHVLYFNGLGLGKTRKRELLAMRYLAKHGIEVTHASVDWYAGESFTDLLDHMVALTKEQVKEHGEIILVGSSAGGSLAINVLGKLHDPSISVVTLCSRLNEMPLKRWDKRSLSLMAHLGTKQPSQAFFDSVSYCTKSTIPKLTDEDKERIITAQQWADFVVPRPTMTIPGVQTYKVPGLGHGWGIAMATRRLPASVRIVYKAGLTQKYPNLAKWPHSNGTFYVPISGLMVEIFDRKMAVRKDVTKIPLEKKHKEARDRISTCCGYLITIHCRLFNHQDVPKLFLDRNLDWESLRVYTQILLDSFAALVPILYGITPEYEATCPICHKTPKKDTVNSFNQLEQWIDAHNLDDDFTKRYLAIKKDKNSWYKLVNMDRTDFIHKHITPDVIHEQRVAGHKIEKAMLMRLPSKPDLPAEFSTIEKEVDALLRNLFELLTFSSNFFLGKVSAQGCVVGERDQYKLMLWFKELEQFNETIFGPEIDVDKMQRL